MKHKYGILLLLFAITYCGYSQNRKLSFGVEGGPDYSYFKEHTFRKNDDRPIIGYSSGLFVYYRISKIFSLETGCSVEQKGFATHHIHHYVDGYYYGQYWYSYHFKYLTAPILLRIHFLKNDLLYLNAGSYFGYLLDEKEIRKSDYADKYHFDSIMTKRFDVGIVVGLGVSKPVKKRFVISIEVRDNIGLSDICPYTSPPYSYAPIIKTNSFNIRFGIKYLFKDKDSAN